MSVERILDEILAGKGLEAAWAERVKDKFFVRPSAKTIAAFGQVSQWAHGSNHVQAAIARMARAPSRMQIKKLSPCCNKAPMALVYLANSPGQSLIVVENPVLR